KEKAFVYLKHKLDEYNERFGNKNINRFIDFYDQFPDTLQQIFSLFHFEFNYLLKYMNSRLNNRHYTADESRDLIYLIEEYQTVQSILTNSSYSFDIDPYYKDVLAKCDDFLQSSGGSPIPNDFEKIKLIEINPIFTLQSAVSITRSTNKILYPMKAIGQGSYATVHKYKDEHYNRIFAVKKANNNLSPKEYERFQIEFEEMKKLKSPYILEVYTFDEENHQYIMEYANDSLDSYISKHNNLSKVKRLSLIKQIFEAFIYINKKNIFHRDISPNNILIKQYDELDIIKVSDFGLVKRQNSQLTSKNTEFKGSFNDPKLDLQGFANYEIRHETYALTRLIYFVVTGKRKLKSFPSTEFEAFINKGLSDNINERYNNTQEIRDAFNKIRHTL
ncbi:protein kinase domain-containing protein, partial [Bacillus hominis]|uniref:protein kinase domain-containing protein n=1 Tax=Bacillus hominis TaxID=2817478 RepID=UPI001BB3168E